jgi:hypothetical protein
VSVGHFSLEHKEVTCFNVPEICLMTMLPGALDKRDNFFYFGTIYD